MVSYTWNGVSGDWETASDWTPAGGPPTPSDSATIGGTGTYTVTVDSSDAANSLTLSDANATVSDTGSLTIGGTFSFGVGNFNIGPSSTPGSLSVGGMFSMTGGALNIDDGTLSLGGVLTESAGSITLASGGTISGGTVDASGGAFNWNGGTLSGVTYEGALNLTASDATGVVTNGLTMAGSNGSGAGTINVTGNDARLFFDNTQTFNGATINLGNVGSPNYLYSDDVSGAGDQVLTLGSGVTIDVQGYAEITAGGYSGDAVVNNGVIDQNGGDSLRIEGNAFTNASTGIINDTSSGGLSIETANFTNQGTINVENNQTLAVPSATIFDNSSGTINVDGTSRLVLDEDLTTAQLGAVDAASGATLDFAGGLYNSAATLQLGDGVLVEGSIYDGTINGAINLTARDRTLSFIGGVTVDNAAGTGPGTINVTANDAELNFDETQTFNGATISLGDASSSDDVLSSKDVGRAGDQVLTLGSGVMIDVQGYAQITAGDYSGDAIVNQGVIDQNSGESLLIDGNVFTNAGTGIINSTSTGGLLIGTDNFTNQGAINVRGTGTSEIEREVVNSGKIAVSSGTLDLDGAVTGKGTDKISKGGTLDFESTVGVGQTIDYLRNGGTLDLTDPKGFSGRIKGFAGPDDLAELQGYWTFFSFSENSSGTVGTLTLADGATHHAFKFDGDYAAGDFGIISGATTTIKFS